MNRCALGVRVLQTIDTLKGTRNGRSAISHRCVSLRNCFVAGPRTGTFKRRTPAAARKGRGQLCGEAPGDTAASDRSLGAASDYRVDNARRVGLLISVVAGAH
jgi:hypothetical protein